jgi:hypothetical protein
MIHTAAWLQLLFLLADRQAQRPSLRNSLFLTITLAVQFLAGHAQLWVYSLLFVSAYALTRAWFAHRAVQQVVRAGSGVLLAIVVSLLLAAVQVAPTAELVLQSSRSDGAERYAALTYSFWPWRFITLIAPDFFGNPAFGNYWGYANYWEDHAYVGVLPLTAALVAIWNAIRRKPNPPLPPAILLFFSLTIPISLLLALGWNTPIFVFLFDNMPGFSFFRAPARLLLWYALAVSALAGAGIQWLQITPQNRRPWRRLLAVCVAVALAGFAGGFLVQGRSLTFVSATRSAGVLLALTIILLLLRPIRQRAGLITEQTWQGLVIVFVAADLLLAGWPLIPTLPPAVFTSSIETGQILQRESSFPRYFVDPDFERTVSFDQYLRFKSFGPAEVGHWQEFKETLVPNFGVYELLPSAGNNDPLVIGHWAQVINRLKQMQPAQRQQLLAAMGVQFYIDGDNRSGWPVIHQTDAFAVQAVPDPLPRAYFVTQAGSAADVTESLRRLEQTDFDSRQEIVIIGDGFEPVPGSDGGTTEPVPVVVAGEGGSWINLAVTTPTAGFVVLTDTFYPGWQARVDGNPAQIWQANASFRAVEVPAGEHQINFNYQPASFVAGGLISVATAVVLLMLLIWQKADRTSS